MLGVDTIFAWATGLQASAVGMMRISGPACMMVCNHLCGEGTWELLTAQPYRLRLRGLGRVESRNGLIDRGLVVGYRAPNSYTGEDLLELQVHGSPAVRDALLRELSGLPGLRPAEGGEFTRRAVLAGKLDLTQAEGVHDLVHAVTEAQRVQALAGAEGELGRLTKDISRSVLDVAAYAEACLDFSDEELPTTLEADVDKRIEQLVAKIEGLLSSGRRALRLRSGLKILLVGAVNTGKSTLMNRLIGVDRSITSSAPGTTRDLVTAETDVAGFPVEWIDSAGWRPSEAGQGDDIQASIEREGIVRMIRASQQADLILFVQALEGPGSSIGSSFGEEPCWWKELEPFRDTPVSAVGPGSYGSPLKGGDQPSGDILWVWNKSDLLEDSQAQGLQIGGEDSDAARACEALRRGEWLGEICVSGQEGYGTDALHSRIRTWLEARFGPQGVGRDTGGVPMRERHLAACRAALDELRCAQSIGGKLELRSEYLRQAANALMEITDGHLLGHAELSERLLDRIFCDFCIGK